MNTIDFQLILISDRKTLPADSLQPTLERILKAGLPALQLREKDLCDRELYNLALSARALTRRTGARLLINGRWDIAKAVGADGVHLPEDSLPISLVRQALGKKSLIGKSTHSLAGAKKAQREGADFITFGPVFATPSKAAFGPPAGLAALEEVCGKITIPVFALGGITTANAANVLRHGAHGIALISGIWKAKDPEQATREYLEILTA